MKILGDDAGIPRAARRSDHASKEIRKDSRKDQLSPAFHATDAAYRADFLQVGRNCHRPSDDVEQNVPLRSEQEKQDGANAEPSAQTNQDQQDDREKSVRRDGGSDLGQRLRDASQARAESNLHTYGNSPGGTNQESHDHAKECCAEPSAQLSRPQSD